ncbi:MAG TPA: ester cyclase, partial [Thermomicrobiales bacterium]|nr:ester cyclase [Thermomicrobiales bacterium]
QRDSAISNAQEDARRVASLAASDQGRQIDSTRQLLTLLARLPEIRGNDVGICSSLLASLLADFPLYANLGTIAPDGTLVCSGIPPKGPVNLKDRDYFQRAVETRGFAVGEYEVGRVTNTPTLNCAYPIVDRNGTVQLVVYAAIELSAMNTLASEAALPPEAALTVIDRRGTVLARAPDHKDWVGKSISATPVVQTILREGRGVADAPDAEGRQALYAFAPLSGGATASGAQASPSAYLSVTRPRSSVVADANTTFSNNLTWFGLVTALALVAAWVGGDLLVRRDTEANKGLVRHLYEAFRTGSVDLLDEVVAPDFVDHDPMPEQAQGLEGLKQAVAIFRVAFPDGQIIPDEVIAEGNTVVARVTLHGTQSGEFFGVSPTGDEMTADGIETYVIKGGKITEGWSLFGPLRPDRG